MRRDGALAKDYAKRHNVPKWYDDATALIEDPDVDAVYIATHRPTIKTIHYNAPKPVNLYMWKNRWHLILKNVMR